MSIKILQLHKRDSIKYKYIQDRYDFSSDHEIFALADGTTQSFKSELWAKIITNEFIKNPIFSPLSLITTFKGVVAAYKGADIEFSQNPAKASLEKVKQRKGGTATFIGIRLQENKNIEVISCGDSSLFLVKSQDEITPFPFSDIHSLDANNYFINTEHLLDDSIDQAYFKTTSLPYNKDDTIILATDALSRFIFKNPNEVKYLLGISTFDDFLEFCLSKWESKELEDDDISAVIIYPDDRKEIQLCCPSIDFEFPKEKEEIFIPSSLLDSEPRTYPNMASNEIRNQFNGLAKDIHHLKSKLKLHEILLILIVCLLMVNMFISYLIRPKKTPPSRLETPETISDEFYDDKIQILQSEIKNIKNQISEMLTPSETSTTTKENDDVPQDEVKKKQLELIEAGYDITADGIWGPQSEESWQDYRSKKANK